jgi:hypothetical protein
LEKASRVHATKRRLTRSTTSHASKPALNLKTIIQIRDKINPPTSPAEATPFTEIETAGTCEEGDHAYISMVSCMDNEH